MKKIFSLMACLLLLSGCGFHLRGVLEIPEWLDNVAVISKEGTNEIASVLKPRLEGYKIRVNPDPSRASYWLIIHRSTYHQKIISIGASTNPRQYQMMLIVEYELQSHQGHVIKEPAAVVVTRQLTVNNDRILGSNDEEMTLLREMRQDAVTQILNKLSRK